MTSDPIPPSVPGDPSDSDTASQPRHERRRYIRRNVNWPVKVELMIPEETFRPQALNGTIRNISCRGMLVTLYEMEQSLYRKMLAAQRYMKVYLDHQDSNLSLDIVGKIVWVDYHSNAQPRVFCNVGLYFDNLVPVEERQINKLLDSLNTMPDSKP
ncbi:MAG: hypothetical protein Kow0059_16230 [Candidatus Sumerlaeia bacterium]